MQTNRKASSVLIALIVALLSWSQTNALFAQSHQISASLPTGTSAVDLAVTIEQGADSAPGGEVPFFITVSNQSQTTASNAQLTVTLTLNLLYRQSDLLPQSAPAVGSGGQIIYQLGTLAPNESRSLRLDTNVTDPARGATILDAAVSSDQADSVPTDNEARFRFLLRNTDLQVLLSQDVVNGEAFAANSETIYALDYTNSGYTASAGTLSLTLPAGTTLLRAVADYQTVVTPTMESETWTFPVGESNPGNAHHMTVAVRLPATIVSGEFYTTTAVILPDQSDDFPQDNSSELVQQALPDAANLSLYLDPWSEGMVGGKEEVSVIIANGGLRSANDTRLTVTLPPGLLQRSFSLTPTTLSNNLAVWDLGTLAGGSSLEPIIIGGTLSTVGDYTTTATITSATAESNQDDNQDRFVQPVVALLPPVITQPRWGNVDSLPIFHGVAKPGNLVTLYLSPTQTVAGGLLGSALADEAGNWAISVTQEITPQGWYWFTATQSLNGISSPPTALANFVGGTAFVDANSVTRNGLPTGGFNNTSLSNLRRSSEQVLAMRIVECSPAYSPTLAIDYNNSDGVRLETVIFTPTEFISTTGFVTFTVRLTGDGEAKSTQGYLRYQCAPGGGGDGDPGNGNDNDNGGNHSGGFGGGGINPGGSFKNGNGGCILGCSPGGDDDSGPGTAPGQTPAGDADPGGDEDAGNPGTVSPDGDLPCWVPGSKHKCEPVLIDPDGFVYDALSVRNGALITHSLVTQAWVTLTVQMLDGSFAQWSAQDFADQVNPQLSDAQYADHILRLGYYAFFVPVGSYQVTVSAPGFLPYRSPILRVIDKPITWHVGLERANVGKVKTVAQSVYLPLVSR